MTQAPPPVESSAHALADLQLTVVGDAEGALAAALAEQGARVRTAGLHELGRHAGAHLVIVGKAAVDGGAHALANAPEGTAATVVLPRGAAAARIAACSLGARVVEPTEPAQLARAVLESVAAPPTRELGWTELGPLLDAMAARVALRLGTSRSRGLQLCLGDATAVAAWIERSADDVVDLARESRAPDALGPSVAVDELSWDDDPQTSRLEDEEVARWRRLSAREARPKMIRGLEKGRREDGGQWSKGDSEPPVREDHVASRSDVVPTRGGPARLPAPGLLPSGVMPEEDEGEDDDEALHSAPAMFPLPLVSRLDPDIDETAPRPALDAEEPSLEEDLGGEDDTLTKDADAELSAALAAPPRERATVPERPPRLAPVSPRDAEPPAAPRRPSRAPLFAALALGAVVLVAAPLGVGGAWLVLASPTESPPPPAAELASIEPAPVTSIEAVAPAPLARAPVGPAPDAPAPVVVVAPAAPVAPSAERLEPAARRARSDALVAEGDARAREGDWAAAREAYQAALAMYELNPHAHAGLARERIQAEDGEGALAHARRAAGLRRGRAEYQVLLGRAHRLAGDAPAARAAFDRALELDPNDRDALRALAE